MGPTTKDGGLLGPTAEILRQLILEWARESASTFGHCNLTFYISFGVMNFSSLSILSANFGTRPIGSALNLLVDMIVPTLIHGQRLYVVTERARSRTKAAEISFLYRVSGLSLREDGRMMFFFFHF